MSFDQLRSWFNYFFLYPTSVFFYFWSWLKNVSQIPKLPILQDTCVSRGQSLHIIKNFNMEHCRKTYQSVENWLKNWTTFSLISLFERTWIANRRATRHNHFFTSLATISGNLLLRGNGTHAKVHIFIAMVNGRYNTQLKRIIGTLVLYSKQSQRFTEPITILSLSFNGPCKQPVTCLSYVSLKPWTQTLHMA